MPTTFERTRIASAILTAVAMLSTPAFAADEAPDTTLSLKLPCLKTEELQCGMEASASGLIPESLSISVSTIPDVQFW